MSVQDDTRRQLGNARITSYNVCYTKLLRLWAKIMRHRFRAKDPRSWMLRFHTQTAGSSLTAQQPDNNVVRVTVQALAAVLGGTQSLP